MPIVWLWMFYKGKWHANRVSVFFFLEGDMACRLPIECMCLFSKGIRHSDLLIVAVSEGMRHADCMIVSSFRKVVACRSFDCGFFERNWHADCIRVPFSEVYAIPIGLFPRECCMRII